MTDLTIICSYDFPPTPERDFDYSAVTSNYDGAPDGGGGPNTFIGHGATPWDAVRDLVGRLEDWEEEHK